jgi:Tol biopolymer transport system component/tRNA A-37 threonylcarbamoyl transferase component Bud32
LEPLTPGTRLGSYQITSVLGAGGMGVVYLAHDSRLGRDVAIKVLLPDVVSHIDRLARFRREAQLLASLSHPNIAVIHAIEDSSEAGGPFLVMELVEGPTLADLIGRPPRRSGQEPSSTASAAPLSTPGCFSIGEALAITAQIAEALHAAHERGVVHRDLKPANVKVRPDGLVKVLDFGLAKAFDPDNRSANEPIPSAALATVSQPVTQAGMIVGTVAYMSPEQARGLAVDRRTDIWALGCVLFEMLTGRRAFDGSTFSDTVAAILERDADWSLLPPGTPANVRRVLRRCLAKDPRQRLSAAADVRLELEDDTGTGDVTAVPAPSRSRTQFAIGFAAIVALVAFALGWLTGHRPPVSAPIGLIRTLVSVSPATKLRGPNPFENGPYARDRPSRLAVALSPDGRTLAFTGMKDAVVRLYVRPLGAAEATAVPDTEGADGVFFSPDGAWIGYWSNNAIRKVSVAGGPPVKVCDTPQPSGSSWSADDRIVFATTTIKSVAAIGGDVKTLTKTAEGERVHVLPQIMPGGKWLLFTVLPAVNEWEHTRVIAQSLETGERHTLLEGASDARYAPTGHLVFMRIGRLMAAPFDLDRAVITGGEVGMLDDVMQEVNTTAIQLDTTVGQYSLSSSGTLAYVSGGSIPDMQNTLTWVRRDGSVEPIAAPVRAYFSPRLSPDGRHLAVGTIGFAEQPLWRYDFPEGTMLRLTTEGRIEQPIWTPDGRAITFGLSTNGPYNLFSIPADASAPPARLAVGSTMQFAGAWTPDGKQLVVVEGAKLLLLEPEGGARPTLLYETKFFERMPDLSPDGRWLAYVSNETGRSEVFVRAFPGLGNKRQVSTDGGVEPAWSRDGKKLVYPVPNPPPHTDKARFFEVEVAASRDTLTMSRPRLVIETSFDGGTMARSWDMTRDAERFLIVKESFPPAVMGPHEINFVQGWLDELRSRTAGSRR